MSDPSAPRPEFSRSHAARRLVRGADRAALSTIGAGLEPEGGAPFASLVTLATNGAGAPLLLLSSLAEHTRNVIADSRSALLITDSTVPHANPQEDARVTLVGRLHADPEPASRGRFLARHPAAARYAAFADFAMYRLAVDRVHVVEGFGVAYQIDDPAAYRVPPAIAAAFSAAEADACARLNETRGRDLARLCRGRAVRAVALDADGLDLCPESASDPDSAAPAYRVAFPGPLDGPEALDAALDTILDGAP
ncbi:hypothetical protein [Roseospira marina]|nr:hypothetical protein [Roseospira marina]MBB4314817.1 hypothetical protein [Roseospira marina]MBB5087817.1 hypothetical protein [Roseospira marina]